MTDTTFLTLTPDSLCFGAVVTLAAAAQGTRERRFEGIAYGGGVITDHAWWDAVAFDLASVTAAAPMPVLLQHDSSSVIGVIDQVANDGSTLKIGGKLFCGIDPEADQVAAKADAGAPWQMSVGIFPDRIEEVQSQTSVTLNGRSVQGPATIFRSARVREVSFVALGADATTRASVFSAGESATLRVPVTRNPAGVPMSDNNQSPDLAAQLASMTTERDALQARVTQLETDFAARARAVREHAVRDLLGEAFTADKAAPYLDMTDAQFAAVQALVPTSNPGGLPASFTGEQAPAGSGVATGKVTPEGVRKFLADHPGATYEQAFNALTGAGAFAAPATFQGA